MPILPSYSKLIGGDFAKSFDILQRTYKNPAQDCWVSNNTRRFHIAWEFRDLFAFGVRQAHVPVMRAYLFASDPDPAVSAFSEDASGANLPAAYAPWRALNGGASLLVGPSSVLILEVMKRDGFYLLTDDPERGA
jgi:hypothetical protein